MATLRLTTTVLFSLLLLVSAVHAEDIYIASAAAGSGDGTSCAHARAYTFFNSSGNWDGATKGADKISHGDTVHICGTITGSANSSILTVQGSGAAGADVITIKFETDAILQAPYFGGTNGGIEAADISYITVDGGTNGIIQATDNGSASLGYTYQTYSNGINVLRGSNWEVKNLTIRNMYVRTQADTETEDLEGSRQNTVSCLNFWDTTGISIHDNVLHNAGNGMQIIWETVEIANISIYNNEIYNTSQDITVLSAAASSGTLSNLYIYNNYLHGGTNWLDPADYFHANAIMLSTSNSGNSMDNVLVHRNRMIKDWYENYGGGSHVTSFLFFSTDAGSSFTNVKVYNNLFVMDGSNDYFTSNGFIYSQGLMTAPVFANNTLVGKGTASYGINLDNQAGSTTNAIIRNNIIKNMNYYLRIHGTGALATCDNNVYYNGDNGFYLSDAKTFAQWLSAYTYDDASYEQDPSLSATYTLNVGSVAIDHGYNYSSLFTVDLNNNTRTGTWDIGAYEYGAGASVTTVTGCTISGGMTLR